MQVNRIFSVVRSRQARVDTVLVNVAGHAHQVGKHAVAHRAAHLAVAERIEADVHHAFFTDHLLPVKDRARVFHVEVVRRQQLGGFARGQLLQQRQ